MPPYILASERAVMVICFLAPLASVKLSPLSSIPDSVFRRVALTAPPQDCTHGRAASVQAIVLELLLVTVIGAISPAAAALSINAGLTFSPPAAAPARGCASSAPAIHPPAARGFASSARAITAPPATAASTTTPANARRPTIDI